MLNTVTEEAEVRSLPEGGCGFLISVDASFPATRLLEIKKTSQKVSRPEFFSSGWRGQSDIGENKLSPSAPPRGRRTFRKNVRIINESVFPHPASGFLESNFHSRRSNQNLLAKLHESMN